MAIAFASLKTISWPVINRPAFMNLNVSYVMGWEKTLRTKKKKVHTLKKYRVRPSVYIAQYGVNNNTRDFRNPGSSASLLIQLWLRMVLEFGL